MIILGLLLLLVAVGAGAVIYVGTADMHGQIHMAVLGFSIGLTPLALAVAGATIVLLLWLGFAVLRFGARRNARKRRDAKERGRVAQEEQARAEQTWSTERQRVEPDQTAEGPLHQQA